MSSSGVFNVITNTGKQDKLLYAHDYLKKRINEFIIQRKPNITEEELLSLPDNSFLSVNDYVLPSLNIMEQSHTVFVNGTYKPSLLIASEYFKVPYSGPKFGEKISFDLPNAGNFMTDCVLHIKIKGLSAKDPRDRVRYVALLGHKLLENVQFTVDTQHIIDEYTTDDYNAHYQFEVPEDKKIGWLRGVGQEIPTLGYLTSDPTFDMHREYKWIGNGNQTLKYSHGTVELMIPLLFWFKEIKNALPSHIIPWGRTQIQVKLAEVNEIVGFANNGGGGLYNEPTMEFCDLYINNLFTPPEIFDIYKKKFVFSLIRVHKHHKELIKTNSENEHEVRLNNLKWPTEALYFSFRPRSNLTLSQYWYKNCKLTERKFKVPVVAKDATTVITGTVSSATTNTAILVSIALSGVDSTYNNYDFVITGGKGYDSTDITNNRYTITAYNGTTKQITISGNWNGYSPDNTTTFELFTPQLAINLVSYYEESPVVDTIALIANSIEIYKSNSEMFYNSYIPYKYNTINTPHDRGQYLMSFCMEMLKHNPSGSLNVSLCRELYLRFTSRNINSSNPVDLIVLSRAINFLLVDNATLTLKYSS